MNFTEKDIIKDYPFQTYTDYINAFRYMLTKKSYKKKYPVYESAHYYYGLEINELLVKNFISLNQNNNTQNAFDQFISIILEGKYVEKYVNTIRNIIKIFIDAGVQLNIARLLDRRYNIEQSGKYFEDEIVEYKVRAILLDIFADYNINLFVKRYCNWQTIKPTYYENIPCNTPYDVARFMVLKYYSKYLQSL